MAERVEEISDLAELPRAGRPGQYDWQSWCDGSVWRLTPADFPGTDVEGMRRLVRAKAKQRG
jgi:hypothetical protein